MRHCVQYVPVRNTCFLIWFKKHALLILRGFDPELQQCVLRPSTLALRIKHERLRRAPRTSPGSKLSGLCPPSSTFHTSALFFFGESMWSQSRFPANGNHYNTAHSRAARLARASTGRSVKPVRAGRQTNGAGGQRGQTGWQHLEQRGTATGRAARQWAQLLVWYS